MFKKLITICSAVVLSVSFAVDSIASAAVVPPERPTYTYAGDCISELSISNSTATCKSTVRGYSNITTQIDVEQTLLTLNSSGKWESVCQWNASYNDYHCVFTNSASIQPGSTYRLKSVFTVYAGSNHETITKYS